VKYKGQISNKKALKVDYFDGNFIKCWIEHLAHLIMEYSREILRELCNAAIDKSYNGY
jgi:hypothetical protein